MGIMRFFVILLLLLALNANAFIIAGFRFGRDTIRFADFRIAAPHYKQKISSMYEKFINNTYDPSLDIELLVEKLAPGSFQTVQADDLNYHHGFNNMDLPDIIAFSHSHALCRMVRAFFEHASFQRSHGSAHRRYNLESLTYETMKGRQEIFHYTSLDALSSHNSMKLMRVAARWQAEKLFEKGRLYRHGNDPRKEFLKLQKNISKTGRLTELQLSVRDRFIHVVLVYGIVKTGTGNAFFHVYDPVFPRNSECSITYDENKETWTSSHYGEVYAYCMDWD